MAKDYYKGGYRAMRGGFPIRLAFKPSVHALAVMREGEPGRGGFDKATMAESYTRWLAARDGVCLSSDLTVKAVPIEDVPEGKTWKERRTKAVRFEAGRDVSARYGQRHWKVETILAEIAIPHWDHYPTTLESRMSLAA